MVCQLPLSQACERFIHYKKATGKSPHTILDHQTTLKKMRSYFKDNAPLASLTREKLVSFFSWLQDDYFSEPDGVAPRGKIKLAPKSIANIHTNLSTFWSWAMEKRRFHSGRRKARQDEGLSSIDRWLAKSSPKAGTSTTPSVDSARRRMCSA